MEWPERGAGWLPQADLELDIDMAGSGRRVQARAHSPAGESLPGIAGMKKLLNRQKARQGFVAHQPGGSQAAPGDGFAAGIAQRSCAPAGAVSPVHWPPGAIVRGCLCVCLLALSPLAGFAGELRGVQYAPVAGGTRLTLNLSAPTAVRVFSLKAPDRLVVDLPATTLRGALAAPPGGTLRAVRTGPQAGGGLRVVFELAAPVQWRHAMLPAGGGQGPRVQIDVLGGKAIADADGGACDEACPASRGNPRAGQAALRLAYDAACGGGPRTRDSDHGAR